MKILFYLSSIISGLITIGAFTLLNSLTATFNPTRDLYGGGNGNTALFFLIVSGLFMCYFAFTVILMFKAYHEKKSKKLKLILFGTYFVLTSVIFTRMLWDANHLMSYINENHPYMVVGLFSQFSNNIFFNFWTFIGSIAALAILSFLIPNKNKNHIYE
ncbi:hypothetical protein ACIQ34_07310 [Ureibacillus sp. NPDC094379]